jgi:hypothetical protein
MPLEVDEPKSVLPAYVAVTTYVPAPSAAALAEQCPEPALSVKRHNVFVPDSMLTDPVGVLGDVGATVAVNTAVCS